MMGRREHEGLVTHSPDGGFQSVQHLIPDAAKLLEDGTDGEEVETMVKGFPECAPYMGIVHSIIGGAVGDAC